ncbi:MAG: peptidoglycan bridge formation glycyltransferase FemA/FemB family protein [Marinilabiliaceae bacterium]|nr:peptidoglycan bridge formation glycyltransferase FemA/FemB family protein [Marinilabiliaceae bacterium]
MIDSYEYKWTCSAADLKEWDLFLKGDPRGHCQQVSHWLASFKHYGADFEVLMVRNKENRIVAGVGVLIIGIPFFKVVIAPSGPVISAGHDQLFEDILHLFLEKARQKKAFYCHLNVPALKEDVEQLRKHTLSTIHTDSLFFSGRPGNQFKFVASINGFRPVIIPDHANESSYKQLFNSFNTNTRRNIRKAAHNELELKFATTEAELKQAYSIIAEVAELQQYRVRSWDRMKDMLLNMIEDGLCLVPCCYANGRLKGALVLWDIGQRLTYVYGGILREMPDLKGGHFLHHEMLKYSIRKGYSFYDFGVAGNEGVSRFKEGFQADHIEFNGTRYWVLNKVKYLLYEVFSWSLERIKS